MPIASDNPCMGCLTCHRPSVWRAISLAAAKSASASFRKMGAGRTYADWPERAAICARCPLYVVRGKSASCGKPFLAKVNREPEDGCGCPIAAKTRDPEEHCPIDVRHFPAKRDARGCSCKWCVAKAKLQSAALRSAV